jgi:RNA polymerase sigma-70 factor (ECF subfamily)
MSTPPIAPLDAPPLDARSEFSLLVAPVIPALRLHCYRIVGLLDEAEDMVQEALMRAWRHRDRLADPVGMRPWLFRIATNACLDLLDWRRARPPARVLDESSWPEPIPDDWLPNDTGGSDPAEILIRREAIDLAFLTAVQALAPRPRAILVLRDVLEWSASDVAEALEMSETAVHSALRRARHAVEDRTLRPKSSTHDDEWSIARRYLDAWSRGDMAGLADLLAADARMAMPPDPRRFEGRSAILAYFATMFAAPPERRIRLMPTRANGRPAFVVFALDPATGGTSRIGVKVLIVREGRIAEVRGYMRADLAERFECFDPEIV